MTFTKKISSTLSIAASVLLSACGSDSGDTGNSAPDAVANTTAPLLIGSWKTRCLIISQGTSTTTTGASGSGGGSVTGGDSYIAKATFTQPGNVTLSTEFFASTDCNTNTSNGSSDFSGVYFIGAAGLANDGSDVTSIDFSNASSTTYSIFQIVSDSNLYLGNEAKGSTGKTGIQQVNRHDGLGEKYLKSP